MQRDVPKTPNAIGFQHQNHFRQLAIQDLVYNVLKILIVEILITQYAKMDYANRSALKTHNANALRLQ